MRLRAAIGALMLVTAGCSNDPAGRSVAVPASRPLPPMVETSQPAYAEYRAAIGTWQMVGVWSTEFDTPPQLEILYDSGVRLTGDECAIFGGIAVNGGQIRYVRGPMALPIPTERTCPSRDEELISLVERMTAFEVEAGSLLLADADGRTASFTRVSTIDSVDRVDDGTLVAVPRFDYADERGALVRLQEQEAADGFHPLTTVGWVAWSPGSGGSGDPFAWQAATIELAMIRSTKSGSFWRFGREYGSPCLLGGVATSRGIDTLALRHRFLRSTVVELVMEEEQSRDVEVEHTSEGAAMVVVDCFAQAEGLEVGYVENLGSDWRLVSLEQQYADPVVVAGPPSFNGGDPGVIEVRSVGSNSFEIRFQEWDYLDGLHPVGEDVAYLVVERGVTVLPSGARIEAGSTSVSSTPGEVRLSGDFEELPVLVATVVR